MRTQLKKIVLAAGIMLAMAFTFSCSSKDESCEGEVCYNGNSGGSSNVASLSGTWYASGERSVVFTGNTFNYKVNNETVYSGTFSVSGSTMTFNIGTQTATCNNNA